MDLTDIQWELIAPWADLPGRYPSYQTCHRRFQQWSRDGSLKRALRALAKDLKERGDLDLSESFIDGLFVPAKKGGGLWEKPSAAKAPKSWPWQTALVFLSPHCHPLRVLRRKLHWIPIRRLHQHSPPMFLRYALNLTAVVVESEPA